VFLKETLSSTVFENADFPLNPMELSEEIIMMKTYKFLACCLIAVLLAASFSPAVFAQQDNAKLEGVVRDTTGAVIAGATVVVRSTATNSERIATTTDTGFYSVSQLRPGNYVVSVKVDGFSEAQINDLALGVGQARTLDVELKPGQVTAQITVTAGDEPATIDASSNRIGVNVTEKEVAQLPVNGRNFSQLQLLTPGATNTGTGNFNEVRFNARSNEQNQTKLDGIESSAIFDASPGYLTVQGSQFRLQTSLENIQEFRVDSSNYPAEYGTGTGGQINVIGKSGSNQFHGALFHYIRNDAMDARNFFDASEKSPLRLNQFGGSLGGRLIKDRVFFFGSYEGLRQRAGFNVIELTPSDYAREFILSGGTARRTELGLNPSAADLTRIQALRTSGAINAFPTGAGARLALGTVTNAGQFVQKNLKAVLDEDAFSIRIDAKLNDRFNLYGRYQRSNGDLASPDGATGRLLLASQEPDNFVFTLSQLYGSNIVNESKFGINRAPTELRTGFPTVDSNIDFAKSSISLSGSIVQPGVNGGAPTGIASPGGLTRQSSAGNGRAQPIDPSSYSIIDNLSITRGTHAMKFGGEIRLIQVDFDQLGGFQYTYGNIGDFLLNRNLTASFIGDLSASGDFQVATNPVTTISRPQSGFHRGRQNYIIFYGQDEWRIRPNMTVNYGLRYEYYSPNREKDDRAVVFDAATGKLLNASETDFYKASKKAFGPRLAFTWSPQALKGKTVIRLGGGIYYGPGQYEDLIQPIESDVFRTTRTLAGGLTATTATDVTTITAPVTAFTPRAYDVSGYKVPERVTQYGLSIQQELPGNTVATIAYVGSVGRNLFQRSITNKILPGNTTVPLNSNLPTGVGVVNEVNASGQIVRVTTIREFDILSGTSITRPFGEIDFKTSGGTDNYNALQLTVNRRFTKGLTLGGHYQWAHSIGTTQGSNEAQTTQDPFNFNGERGNNTFDIRHSGNISALYELPFGQGKAYELDGVADVLLGGWQIGGILNARTGLPLDIRVTRADLVLLNPATGEVRRFTAPSATSPLPAGFVAVVNTPGGNASRSTRRPDIISGVDPFVKNGDLLFLNPAAFAIPSPGTYGNLSRNALHGPNFAQFDLTLQKRFRLTEKVAFEFRTEIYNLLNKANFANPPATLPDNLGGAGAQQPGTPFSLTNVGNFGAINATVGRTVGLGTNRQIQLSGRITF
jgi:hypothetical protein